jgi:hypothetical protein
MTLQWRKSSSSGTATDEICVEVARLPEGIAVRDSKHPELGHLALSVEGFAQILTEARKRL